MNKKIYFILIIALISGYTYGIHTGWLAENVSPFFKTKHQKYEDQLKKTARMSNELELSKRVDQCIKSRSATSAAEIQKCYDEEIQK